MADWNAGLYNKFEKERIQPSKDLVNRISMEKADRIIDIGCGTGMSTLPLGEKWTEAEIVGVDYSESMLTKAKKLISSVRWEQRDCSQSLADLGKFDLVFSNAALQWLGDQATVIKNLHDIMTEDGILAIQIPNFSAMKIAECIKKAASDYSKGEFEGITEEECVNYSPEYYYNVLANYFSDIQLWQTDYYHVMENHHEILSFIESTALRPYLNRLESREKELFMEQMLEETAKQYPIEPDGRVLFPFKRIFFIAK